MYNFQSLGIRRTNIPTTTTLSKNYFSCSSMGVRQNPWTPTKRRGPIAAEAASPGPAVVSLPSLIGTLLLFSIELSYNKLNKTVD